MFEVEFPTVLKYLFGAWKHAISLCYFSYNLISPLKKLMAYDTKQI